MEWKSLLQSNVHVPIRYKVILIAEPLAAMQTETEKRNPAGLLIEHYAALLRHPVIPAMNAESMQGSSLQWKAMVRGVVEFGEARFAGDQQALQTNGLTPHRTVRIDRSPLVGQIVQPSEQVSVTGAYPQKFSRSRACQVEETLRVHVTVLLSV